MLKKVCVAMVVFLLAFLPFLVLSQGGLKIACSVHGKFCKPLDVLLVETSAKKYPVNNGYFYVDGKVNGEVLSCKEMVCYVLPSWLSGNERAASLYVETEKNRGYEEGLGRLEILKVGATSMIERFREDYPSLLGLSRHVFFLSGVCYEEKINMARKEYYNTFAKSAGIEGRVSDGQNDLRDFILEMLEDAGRDINESFEGKEFLSLFLSGVVLSGNYRHVLPCESLNETFSLLIDALVHFKKEVDAVNSGDMSIYDTKSLEFLGSSFRKKPKIWILLNDRPLKNSSDVCMGDTFKVTYEGIPRDDISRTYYRLSVKGRCDGNEESTQYHELYSGEGVVEKDAVDFLCGNGSPADGEVYIIGVGDSEINVKFHLDPEKCYVREVFIPV